MENQTLRKKINNIIMKVARYMEILMSCIITVVIVIMIIDLIVELPKTLSTTIEHETFNQFLSSALGLVVGIEFVKMLSHYTPETVIEVLMLATARQMVVEHLNSVDTLIGTLAMAVLFAIRKFLFIPEEHDESEKKHFLRRKQKEEESE